MLVDEGGAESGGDDADGEGDAVWMLDPVLLWVWMRCGQHLQGETGGTSRPPLSFFEDDGIGNEEHVQQTVEDGHVQRDEEDDELAEEELQGHDEEDADALADGAHVEVLFRDPVRLACLLAQFLGAAGEDGGRIGLGDGECDQDPDDAGEDEREPV